MEDCGGVSIKFPSADSKSDKVTIRGPKDDVDRAKQQLLDLANERQLASYTAEVKRFKLYYVTFHSMVLHSIVYYMLQMLKIFLHCDIENAIPRKT